MENNVKQSRKSFKIDEDCPIFEMASLDLIDESPPKPKVRRSLRRMSGIFENTLVTSSPNNEEQSQKANETELVKPNISEQPKRRVIKHPRKRNLKELNDDDDSLSSIKDYYLCKKFKRLPSTNETIFEEPKLQKNKIVYVATKKQKRILSFESGVGDKIKKRRLKIKKYLPSQQFLKRKRISMDDFMKKIEESLTESPDILK